MESSKAQPTDSPQSLQKPLQSHSSPPSDQLDDKAHRLPPPCSTVTPRKLPNHPPRPSRTRHQHSDRHMQLPEQYDVLLRLFTGLDSALRLLRMRKSVPFFTRIRAIVESITGRRFGHGHLAQMKFLMPEEVLIKRVSVVDEETGTMKRDLHVTLIRSAFKNNKKRKRGSDPNYCVKKLFRSQLFKFLKKHPQGTEIPEEVLPESSNEHVTDPVLKTNEATGSISCAKVSSDHVHLQGHQTAACHLSKTFMRRFSMMSSDKKTGSSVCTLKEPDVRPSIGQAQDSSPCKKLSSDNTSLATCSIDFYPVSPSSTSNSLPGSDITQIVGAECTPIKLVSTPSKPTVSTPIRQPPLKRCSLTPDDDSTRVTKLVCRPSVARSLQFDFSESDANVELELDDIESTDILEIIPQSLVQSLKEKEKKTEQQTLRRRMIAGLPKLFDRIYYLFQSIKYSAIRKEALLNRLTTCHCDITDESEVEEQLKLLQEVLPEWISHKLSPSGSILLSIDKSLDPTMLRAKLNTAT